MPARRDRRLGEAVGGIFGGLPGRAEDEGGLAVAESVENVEESSCGKRGMG